MVGVVATHNDPLAYARPKGAARLSTTVTTESAMPSLFVSMIAYTYTNQPAHLCSLKNTATCARYQHTTEIVQYTTYVVQAIRRHVYDITGCSVIAQHQSTSVGHSLRRVQINLEAWWQGDGVQW